VPDQTQSVTIPLPLQIVVEDVGWWQVRSASDLVEPFGSGLTRPHTPRDYQALVRLGKNLGMRPQIGLVACEWDRSNLLQKVPTATWLGSAWDNGRNVGPWLDEAAHILRRNSDHLEIALHGVGHEYWQNGVRSRAEFHDTQCNMRPAADIESHLEAFGQILAENRLDPYPESFVPPALLHSFGNGPDGIQQILNRVGIKTVTTSFERARQWLPPRHARMTWECDVLLVERGEAPVPWHVIGAQPQFDFDSPVLSLHWSNLLHQDPAQNQTIVDRWIDYLKPWNETFNGMLAPNTLACQTQLAYHCLANVRPFANGFEIDIRRIKELPAAVLDKCFYIKTNTRLPVHWQLKGGRISHYLPGGTDYPCHEIRPDIHADTLFLKPA
jgi:hypothetical protein